MNLLSAFIEIIQVVIDLFSTNPSLLLLGFSLFIGKLVKKSKRVPDEYIPTAVIVLTGIASFILHKFSLYYLFDGMVYGAVVVGTHSGYAQIRKKADNAKRRKKGEEIDEEEETEEE